MTEQENGSPIAMATVSEPPLPHLTGNETKVTQKVPLWKNAVSSVTGILLGFVFLPIAATVFPSLKVIPFYRFTHSQFIFVVSLACGLLVWQIGMYMIASFSQRFSTWFKQREEDAA